MKIYSFITVAPYRAISVYRLANFLWRKKIRVAADLLSRFSWNSTYIEIHPAASIGENFKINHGIGTVIGPGVIIGDNVTVLQGVTIGLSKPWDKDDFKFPKIGNDVYICAGAKILGDVVIGDNTIIAANSVVTKNISGNCLVGGIPAKVIKPIEKY